MNETPILHVTREGAGPAVVMVHGGPQGGPGGAEQFAAQRPLAHQGWSLILPDRPGHGASPSRGPEDLEVDAVWVADLLADGAHLIGHSYGGVIALCAAGLAPEAVRSLTLIEAPLFSMAPNDPGALTLRDQLASAINRSDPIESLLAFGQAVRLPPPPPGQAPSREQLVRMGEGLRQMRPPYSWDADASLDAVRSAGVPALIVTGGWSPGFEAIGDGLADRLDGERLVIDAGHHFPQVAAEAGTEVPGGEFNRALDRFMRAHDQPRP
jgi:pimeloyl-ACP methyl ester carboxylesterase